MLKTKQPGRRGQTLTAALSASLLALAAFAFIACGDGGAKGEAVASCDSISQIQSYRYSINLKLDSPAFDQPRQGSSPSSTPAPPLSAFAEALEALFSDLKLEGAFRAPDRTQVVLRFKGEELELREVGDKSWIRVGAAAWNEQDPAENDTILTPEVVCKDIVQEIAPSLADVDADRETINNVETDHFRLDRADVKRLPELLGADPETDLPDKFQVDVWLAREGRFPVRLDIGAEDTDEQGNPIGLSLFMEFRDLNDPGIAVEPPVTSPGGG